jgi:hypothetical protein
MWMPGPTVSLINGMSDALIVGRRFGRFATNGSPVPVEVVIGPDTVLSGICTAPSIWVLPRRSANWAAIS